MDKLRIVQGPLRAAATPPAARRKPPPLDVAKEAELARGLETVPDSPLKTALLALGRGVMRRER